MHADGRWAQGRWALVCLLSFSSIAGAQPISEALRHAQELAWKKQFAELRLSCIGKVTAESGLKIRDTKGVRDLTATGYVHFS